MFLLFPSQDFAYKCTMLYIKLPFGFILSLTQHGRILFLYTFPFVKVWVACDRHTESQCSVQCWLHNTCFYDIEWGLLHFPFASSNWSLGQDIARSSPNISYLSQLISHNKLYSSEDSPEATEAITWVGTYKIPFLWSKHPIYERGCVFQSVLWQQRKIQLVDWSFTHGLFFS